MGGVKDGPDWGAVVGATIVVGVMMALWFFLATAEFLG